ASRSHASHSQNISTYLPPLLLSSIEHIRPASTLPRPPSCFPVLLVQLRELPYFFRTQFGAIWEPPIDSVSVNPERPFYFPYRPAFKDSLLDLIVFVK